jgi:hypothetical protein
MPEFCYTFVVDAPLAAVQAFHHDTRALKKLTPPPMVVQLRRVEPLAEGSISEFTLWLGPIPIPWRAVHSDVNEYGFTDTQVRGPMVVWRHTHRFTPLPDGRTRLDEHVVYQHPSGLRGLFTRLLFGRIGLRLLFTWRKMATQRHVQINDTSK